MTNTRAATLRRVLEELGLVSLYQSTLDVKILCLQRFVRLFAYGASTLVLVSFLRELNISPTHIGLFMTLTLAGDVAISFILAVFADGVGRRSILALGAILMVGSGVAFALCSDYWVLLAAAILGVVSPSGNEVGPFRAIEESVVAHLTDAAKRSDVYAWYSLSGSLGTAFGMMTCGWVIQRLNDSLSWEPVEIYRLVFYGYAAAGILKTILVFMLSDAVELEPRPRNDTPAPSAANGDETAPLIPGDRSQEESTRKHPKRTWLPNISKQSVSVASTLCLLFALDSFASGIASMSWITYFFKSRYNIKEGKLGSLFFVTSIIAAASMLVASSLAKRFGDVKTMVFTHLPSAIFLALIPVPGEVHGSIVFLILRSCTQSMDVAPRSAFLAAILLPEERTVVMGLVNVAKTTSQTLGPLITGVLADSNALWVAFIVAGSLKACYDLGLLALFKNHERDRAHEVRDDQEARHAG
ncbi:related to Staphylococcus multidrug resistance protein [Cephalotrichum gorgonifer]|uniref:Related to Staphylococcus multidrug resistance protein n=1 Tax=Cephalotrichum gorgonifer TaxID=2041049 RepID=A0AAE8SU13_9PEZI|nr:related to Staphylococcus multidrug resistance protein [Cephalotrichum gorgonifer]